MSFTKRVVSVVTAGLLGFMAMGQTSTGTTSPDTTTSGGTVTTSVLPVQTFYPLPPRSPYQLPDPPPLD